IRQKLSGSKNFCWLARRIPPEQANRIEALNIDGIFIIKEAKRFYPNGELAGHLLGFVGLDSTGLEGLEKGYEEFIKGTPEKLVWSRDAKGKSIYPRFEKAAATTRKDEGYHLILTIDSRIQHLVETQLQEAIIDKGAKSAFAIIMDPKTGEILAMADAPEIDPNNFSSYSIGQGKNKAIADCFDPGSIFKPFVAAGALQEGIAKETDRFYCENGAYSVANRVIHEAQKKKHGSLTFSEIIKYSSNIGAAKIGEKLGKEKLHDYITRFGFGAKTGIELPGESPGLLRPQQNWTRVDTVTISFGQGVSVTAIQTVTALSAIANQGVLMKPHVVKGLVNRQGQIVKVITPTIVRRVISPTTAKKMTSILTSVVQADDGTGKRARIENVNVGGKT
ncbi:MAG: penicillin-binding protein, partial [Syntrophales bacterium LBB04]|nr:penicillin-binding protein [Syntrophales bacterium LBB04]